MTDGRGCEGGSSPRSGERDLSAQRCGSSSFVSPASVGLRLPFEQRDPRGDARTGELGQGGTRAGTARTDCFVVGSSGCLEFGRVEGRTSGDEGLLAFIELGQLLGAELFEVAGEVAVGLGLSVIERGLGVGPYR
jgi:hypothetical protein